MNKSNLSQDPCHSEMGNVNFLIKHSVGNFPKEDEVDVPLSYAYFYYLEAAKRYLELDSN